MRLPWFKRIEIFFIPISFLGWLIVFCGLGFAVFDFVAIDSHSHSASDTLRPFLLNLLILFALYSLIGSLTQSKRD